MLGRVDGKEELVRNYSDFVQQTECNIKEQYTRSIYAASVTRQIAMMTFRTFEGTLKLLQTMQTMHFSRADHGGSGSRDAEVALQAAVEKGFETEIDTVLNKVRGLELDNDNMEHSVTVLNQVGLFNDAVSIAASDVQAFYVQKDY